MEDIVSREICLTSLRFGAAGFAMYSVLDPWGEDDPLIAEIVQGGFDENETLRLWTYLVSLGSAGDLYADVGAYAGIFALLASRSNSAIKVAAFEASAVTYGRLVSNIILNRLETTICAAHMAAWSDRDVLDFPHRYGIYSMCPGESALEDKEVDHSERVFTAPLDDLLGRNGKLPDALGSKALGVAGFRALVAMKIDVEGAEARVLEGARELVKLHRPYILCELLTGEAVEKVQGFLTEHDYVIEQIGAERNYLLCPREKFDFLTAEYRHWCDGQGAKPELLGRRFLTMDISGIPAMNAE